MGGMEENPNTPQERLSDAQKGVAAPAPAAIDGSAAVPPPDSSASTSGPASAPTPEAVDPAIIATGPPSAPAPAPTPDASAPSTP
jgi:hypothetical protein